MSRPCRRFARLGWCLLAGIFHLGSANGCVPRTIGLASPRVPVPSAVPPLGAPCDGDHRERRATRPHSWTFCGRDGRTSIVVLFDFDRIRGALRRRDPGESGTDDGPAIEPIEYPKEQLADQVWGGACSAVLDGQTVSVDGRNLWVRWKYSPNSAGTLLIADRSRLKESDAAFLREVLGLPRDAPLNDDPSLRVALAAAPNPHGGPAWTLESSRKAREMCARRAAARAAPSSD